MLKPRVFVVMPFGIKEAVPAADGRPAKMVDFDLVYATLLAPALEKAGCEPFRADKEAGAGDIRTDMYFELVTADAVLADISILNPNVFYELGVRHGIAPRGVFMVHGGWSRRPFDVAPDRTIDYDGKLFEPGPQQDGAWQAAVGAQVETLGTALRAALDVDDRTVGSPVYKEMPNLRPVDWSQVETAKFKYFGGVLDDWKRRVRVARARGLAGDILSLANDAPTRYHHAKLLFEAARALVDIKRYDVACEVLLAVRKADPKNLDADCQYGLVLARLGKIPEAEEHLKAIVQAHEDEPEAQGILGRVYKDRWRMQWDREADPTARLKCAARYSSLATRAIRCYAGVTRRRLDSYYTGVNAVGLACVIEHLGRISGVGPASHGMEDLAAFTAVVSFAAEQALERARSGDAGEEVWAGMSLGELALLEGRPQKAAGLYRDAANSAGATWFQVDSALQQVEMYEALAFQAEATGAVKAELEESMRRLGPPVPEYRKVLLASGHMIDAPGRPQPRFPPEKEGKVRERLREVLDQWGVGNQDVALCGGARGSDILFAELCRERGVKVQLCLPLPEAAFLDESVRLPTGDWEARFLDLYATSEVCSQPERLGQAPHGANVHERNNLWILNLARTIPKREKVHAVLVWDERPTGDGRGGTSHFASEVRRLGGRLAIVNPTTL